MNSSAAISIQSLEFEGILLQHSGRAPVLENANFKFPTNEIVWIRAESGSGRSSLMHLLAALKSPTRGRYLINAQDVCQMSFEEFLPYRLKIGFGYDYGGLINNRSLYENVMLPLAYHKILSPEKATRRVDQLFERMEIQKYRDRRPAFVQGTVSKMVVLLRSLILNPEVLILDDPSTGLDQELVLRFFELVEEQRQQKHLKHIFVTSLDEKLMSHLHPVEIHLEQGELRA